MPLFPTKKHKIWHGQALFIVDVCICRTDYSGIFVALSIDTCTHRIYNIHIRDTMHIESGRSCLQTLNARLAPTPASGYSLLFIHYPMALCSKRMSRGIYDFANRKVSLKSG